MKEISESYTKLWNEIRNQIKKINGRKQSKYTKDFMRFRFESDNDLPLAKLLSIHLIVFTGSVFQEGRKYYPQVLLHECLY